MSGRQYLILLASLTLAGTSCCAAGPPDTGVDQIVRHASTVLQSDWAAAPAYAFLQRDEFQRNGKPGSKTHLVVMMAGSDYYMPVAIDDQVLDADQQKSELRKLKHEFERRNAEDSHAHRQRMEKYRKQRDQNGALILDFPNAFTFQLTREEMIHGRAAYVLAATPRKRTGAASRAGKVLSGMSGEMRVEKDTFRILRAESNVTAPISIFGIFAAVLPGTRMELEMAPVTDSLWLVSRFSMRLKVSKLWFRSEQTTTSAYSEYRLNAELLQELLAKAAE